MDLAPEIDFQVDSWVYFRLPVVLFHLDLEFELEIGSVAPGVTNGSLIR